MSTPHIRSARERDERLDYWLGKQSGRKQALPEGATETLLNFDLPGFISITITLPGVTQTINLEEVVGRLECDAYNVSTIAGWEKVFARLAHMCRAKLPPDIAYRYPPVHPASGHAPHCALWDSSTECTCPGRQV